MKEDGVIGKGLDKLCSLECQLVLTMAKKGIKRGILATPHRSLTPQEYVCQQAVPLVGRPCCKV